MTLPQAVVGWRRGLETRLYELLETQLPGVSRSLEAGAEQLEFSPENMLETLDQIEARELVAFRLLEALDTGERVLSLDCAVELAVGEAALRTPHAICIRHDPTSSSAGVPGSIRALLTELLLGLACEVGEGGAITIRSSERTLALEAESHPNRAEFAPADCPIARDVLDALLASFSSAWPTAQQAKHRFTLAMPAVEDPA